MRDIHQNKSPTAVNNREVPQALMCVYFINVTGCKSTTTVNYRVLIKTYLSCLTKSNCILAIGLSCYLTRSIGKYLHTIGLSLKRHSK